MATAQPGTASRGSALTAHGFQAGPAHHYWGLWEGWKGVEVLFVSRDGGLVWGGWEDTAATSPQRRRGGGRASRIAQGGQRFGRGCGSHGRRVRVTGVGFPWGTEIFSRGVDVKKKVEVCWVADNTQVGRRDGTQM